MVKKSYDQCVGEIISDIIKRKTVDYGDKKSVRLYNAAMDRIDKNVQYIDMYFPERRYDFIQLMHHADPHIASTCACMTYYNISCSLELKREAISIYAHIAENGSIGDLSKCLLPFVLHNWEKEMEKRTEPK